MLNQTCSLIYFVERNLEKGGREFQYGKDARELMSCNAISADTLRTGTHGDRDRMSGQGASY